MPLISPEVIRRGSETPPILEVDGVDKSFPGVLAVRSAQLEVRRGEIHALVGENGAGKSSLIKVITGAHKPDRGVTRLNGAPVTFGGPVQAARAGIAAIYQEFNLVPALSVRENLFLGRETGRIGFTQVRYERRRALQAFQRLGVAIDPEVACGDLDIAQQQLVEIARALLTDARLLIMDEPTAALTDREVENLFSILRELRGQGIGIIFISHRLDEVYRIADRITVMRDGATLGSWPVSGLSRPRLIELMVGRPLEREFPRIEHATGHPLLTVRGLSGGRVDNVTFSVKGGEILSLAGLIGAGRTELARLIFGADRKRGGAILLDGRPVKIRTPRDAIRNGICLLTEDRKAQGLVLQLSARDNFALPNLDHWTRSGWIDTRRESAAFERFVEDLQIRLTGPHQPAEHLSGGNQQKLLLARWLQRNSRVVIFDEPTRGVDVGAKYEIYQLIGQLAAEQKAVIMISSELPEILGMSDRILVMHEGRITGEITEVAAASQQQILRMAVS